MSEESTAEKPKKRRIDGSFTKETSRIAQAKGVRQRLLRAKERESPAQRRKNFEKLAWWAATAKPCVKARTTNDLKKALVKYFKEDPVGYIKFVLMGMLPPAPKELPGKGPKTEEDVVGKSLEFLRDWRDKLYPEEKTSGKLPGNGGKGQDGSGDTGGGDAGGEADQEPDQGGDRGSDRADRPAVEGSASVQAGSESDPGGDVAEDAGERC
jgi:hypothetical protein